MIYRVLGKTGYRISQLGFGAMRLPMVGSGAEARVDRGKAIPMIRTAFEGGVNYIDTATMYCNDDSQRVVGEALQGWRDKVWVSTKNPEYGENETAWWKNLENSLERLRVSHIDVYHHHGVNGKSFKEMVLPRVSKWMLKAKGQGLVKHIAISFHDNCEALSEIARSGYPEVITIQYNMLDRQLEEGIALAHERGIGVVVMGPVGGGRLVEQNEVLGKMIAGMERIPELALRFVFANVNVSCAISGMSTMDHVVENLRVGSDASGLSEDDHKAIAEHLDRLKKMADLYCTGCGYCMPCPAGVNIPSVFSKYNSARVYGLWDWARSAYENIGKSPWDAGSGASACKDCGLCEPKCPQKLAIREQLREAGEALARPRSHE